MYKHLKKEVDSNPILKTYCLKLEQIGFNVYNFNQKSKRLTIFAQKEDTHFHKLNMIIDSSSKKATITIKTRLIWDEHTKLSLPGHNIQLEIDGESDYDYNYDHSFTLSAAKTKTNVKYQDLVKTIKSMLDDIQAAYEDLTK